MVDTKASTKYHLDLSEVEQHIIPAVGETYDLGSADLKWRYVYALTAIFGSILIGGAINLSEIDGVLFVNASTWINGSLNVSDDINTADIFADNLVLTNNLNVTGEVNLTTDTYIGGDLDVAGNILLGQNLTINPSGYFVGDMVVDGNLTVLGTYVNATVVTMYLNGTFLPYITDIWDIGSQVFKWKNGIFNGDLNSTNVYATTVRALSNIGIATIPNDPLTVEGDANITGNLTQPDNSYHCFGSGDCSDSYIFYNGTMLIIKVN